MVGVDEDIDEYEDEGEESTGDRPLADNGKTSTLDPQRLNLSRLNRDR